MAATQVEQTNAQLAATKAQNAVMLHQLELLTAAVARLAANSGLPHPPGWYFNLRADPHLTADLDGRRLALRAELLADDELPARWEQVLSVAPDYQRYVDRLGMIPPIFRLVSDDPTDTSGSRNG